MSSGIARCAPAEPALHHIVVGDGEAMVLLHGSASTGALWREVTQTLQPLFIVCTRAGCFLQMVIAK